MLKFVLMKWLSWNIRGLGRPEKMRKIRKLLADRKIDMALFQETKKASISSVDIKRLWPRDNFEFMAVDAEGRAGGLLCIWDPDVFQLSDCCSNRSYLLLAGTVFNSFACVVINVYAPNDTVRRGKLWETLVSLKAIFHTPWCVGGDFNEIRSVGDRVGYLRRERGMKDFNEFIDRCELTELQMLGRKFTWCNAFDGNKWSKIDRFLLSPKWIERFKLNLWGLPRLLSDHCPLLLLEEVRDWGPKPFKFSNAWLLHPSFASHLASVWKEPQIKDRVGAILQRKLHVLKSALKQWSKEVYGNVPEKLKAAESELHSLDVLAEVRPLVEAELQLKREIRSEMWRLNRMLEWSWLQKSRLEWNLKGDRNTRFFHVMASSRQNRNALNSILVDERVVEELEHVKQEVWAHFNRHFSEEWRSRPTITGDFKNVRCSNFFQQLETEFSEEETWAAVKECDGNKAPGPDGFNLMCFQKNWKVFKEEVMSFMKELYSLGRLSHGMNSSFITLIPKTVNAGQLNDYRPISLIGSIYKILSKVVASRLKSVMSEVISDTQSAFVGEGISWMGF